MRLQYSSKTRFLLILPFVALFVCVVGVRISTSSHQAGQIGDVTGALRGRRILVLHFPEAPALVHQLEVYEDGTAGRAVINATPIRASPVVKLSVTTWQAVEQLRRQWCAQPPAFRSLRADEPFYDVGLRCSDPFAPRRVQVPLDQLPPALEALLASVPAP